MTPATIAGFAKLAGADIIAIADHNSAKNLPAAKIACHEYGLLLLPAIEVTTADEIHVVCYFKSVEDALKMGEIIYNALPSFEYDTNIWGKQLVVDENDIITDSIQKLLTNACSLDIYDLYKLCTELGAIAVPAHVEKDSYSLLSVLGFAPEDIAINIIEMKAPEKYEALCKTGRLPTSCEILTSSDAHCVEDIAKNLQDLKQNSILYGLINTL